KLPTIGFLGGSTASALSEWTTAFVQRLRELGWIDTAAKRLELLREVVPNLRRLAIMGNVGNPFNILEMEEVQAVARTLGLDAVTLEIRRGEDIAPAFGALEGRAEALYVGGDPLLIINWVRISTLALGARLPTISTFRHFAAAGGLMSY